jgi:ABC-type branched-subunit amino acid transport system substrate-binding protein
MAAARHEYLIICYQINTAMTSPTSSVALSWPLSRRLFLRHHAVYAAGAVAAPSVWAQNSGGILSAAPTVGQVVDMSSGNQDVSKDFLVGSRAAWQEINATGGLRGQTVRHVVIETDGSAAQSDAAWEQLQRDSSCIASFGSCGNALAVELTQKSSAERNELVHVAPWLQNSALDIGKSTHPIFSNREQQIRYALQSMTAVGVDSITVVYQDQAQRNTNAQDIRRVAGNLKLALREMHVQTDLTEQARQISAMPVPLVLFVGGTPELVQFMRGWRQSNSLRYIIALADVNLQTAQQMSAGRYVPIIGTQVVPMVTAALPIVRRYRAALAKYYDEPPTALSLAGYIAARYTAQILRTSKALNRSSTFEAFARRSSLNLEGFAVDVDNGKLQSAYVTQSMLSADGRLVG